MSLHRVIYIPASQVKRGDVILSYKGSSDGELRVFVGGYGVPVRDPVTEVHMDHADGEIYIKTANASQYCAPYDHIHLDCLLTFGKNTGETK